MKNDKEIKTTISLRMWLISVGLPLFVVGMCTLVMYSEKAKFEKKRDSSSVYTTEDSTYIVNGVECTETKLIATITEPTLVLRVIEKADGTIDYEDCYVTFSSERAEILKEYRNGVFTIVIPRTINE